MRTQLSGEPEQPKETTLDMLTLAAPNPAPRGSSHRAGRCSEDSSVGLDAPKTPSLPGQAPGWGDTKLDSARTRAPPESGCGWGLLTAPRAPFPADRRLLTQRITHDRPSHVQERGLGHRPLAGRGGEGRGGAVWPPGNLPTAGTRTTQGGEPGWEIQPEGPALPATVQQRSAKELSITRREPRNSAGAKPSSTLPAGGRVRKPGWESTAPKRRQ